VHTTKEEDTGEKGNAAAARPQDPQVKSEGDGQELPKQSARTSRHKPEATRKRKVWRKKQELPIRLEGVKGSKPSAKGKAAGERRRGHRNGTLTTPTEAPEERRMGLVGKTGTQGMGSPLRPPTRSRSSAAWGGNHSRKKKCRRKKGRRASFA